MAARKKATSARSKATKKKTAVKKKTAAKKKTTKAPPAKKKTSKKPAAKKSAPAKKKTTATKKAAAKKKTTAKKATAPASRGTAKKATAKKASAAATRKPAKKKAATGKKAPAAVAPEPAAPPTPGRAVIAFSGSDVRSKLGEKYTCFACGAAFYDLGRDDKVCPKCGANQADKPKEGSQPTPSAPRSTRRAARPMAPLLEEDDDAVRYNEEFDLGIQENGGDEDESPGGGDQDLFPDSGEAEEADDSDDD